MDDDMDDGCAENGRTDPTDESMGRTVARCEPGWPQPKPLAERETVKLGNRFRAEFVAPILLAEHYGLFEEENIDVEWVELSLTDSMVPMDDCDVDFAVGGTEASFHNGVANGLDVKMVLGNYFPPDAGDPTVDQTGLWVRRDVFSDPANPDITELKGARVASAVGLGSVVIYPVAQAFDEAGFSLLDMEFEQIPSGDHFTALENNAVQAAWMLDPYWIEAAADPDNYVLLVTQTPGEPLGGIYAGPCVRTGDKMEAGQAFVRAYIRAINTYLPLEYQDDAEVMAALEEETGATLESLETTPPLYFDWEMRATTSQNAQKYFIEFETVEYTDVLTDDQVMDRSMYDAVIAG
jgi:NitT/TauT family transport system substrate-binding protein